jgi:hypothetical protein
MRVLPRDDDFEIDLSPNVISTCLAFLSRKVKRTLSASFMQPSHLWAVSSLVCFFELFLCFIFETAQKSKMVEEGVRLKKGLQRIHI